MIGQCIADKIDIFCMGVVLGALAVILAKALERGLNLWLNKNQMKLDLMLGQAILKMKHDLEKGNGTDEK